MLQSPSLIDPLRHILLLQPRQIRRMIHPYLHPISPKLLHQRRKKRSTRWIRRLASAAQCIRQDAKRQVRVLPQRLSQRLDELLFRFSNVQRRQEYPLFRIPYPILLCKTQSAS